MSRPPLLLAFDTATQVASVALGRGPEVLARGFLTGKREHSAGLVPLIGRVLEEAGVRRSELDGLVLGHGPGSFTGVRIAAATGRGLARGLDRSIWTYSSLEAGAASAGATIPESVRAALGSTASTMGHVATDDPRPRYVLFDARGDRVYAACYRLAGGMLETLVEPRASTLGEVLDGDTAPDALFCGDGALRHAEVLARAGHQVLGPPAGLPTAEGLLRLHDLTGGAAAPRDWAPEYLRSSSAQPPGSARKAAP